MISLHAKALVDRREPSADIHAVKGVLVVETSSTLTDTSLYIWYLSFVEEADMQAVKGIPGNWSYAT